MSDTKRTVVIEMSDDVYQALALEAEKGDMTVGELLMNHTLAFHLSALANEGDSLTWLRLYKLWRKSDPLHAPGLDVASWYGEVGEFPTE